TVDLTENIPSRCNPVIVRPRSRSALVGVSRMNTMETRIDLKRLQYADLLRLGRLAAEAMALAQEYDQSRSRAFCELVAACNVEMLARRRQATRYCGTAL